MGFDGDLKGIYISSSVVKRGWEVPEVKLNEGLLGKSSMWIFTTYSLALFQPYGISREVQSLAMVVVNNVSMNQHGINSLCKSTRSK